MSNSNQHFAPRDAPTSGAPLSLDVSHFMYRCPSCQQRTISFLRKLWNGPAFPATCHNCGKQSYIPTSRGNAVAVALILFVTASGFVAAALKSALPLLIGVLLAFLALLFRIRQWHRTDLQNISPQDVAGAKKESTMAAIIFFLISFIQ